MELLLIAAPLAIAGGLLIAIGPAIARKPDTPERQGRLLARLSPIVGGAALAVALAIVLTVALGA